MTTLTTEQVTAGIANTTCFRCGSDVEFAPFDLPAPGQPDRRVCATEDGAVGPFACGVSDAQVAVSRELYNAAHQDGPRGDALAAKAKAEALLDTIAEGVAAYLIEERNAWLDIATYALLQANRLNGGAR